MGPSVADEASRRRFAVAVPAAGATIVLFAVLLTPAVPQGVRATASAAGLLLAGVTGAVSCGLAARRTTGRRRRSWTLIMAAAVMAVSGNVWTAVTAGSDPSPSSLVSDATIAVALLLSIAGLLHFPTARRRGLDLLVMALDGLVMGAAVLIIASVLVYDDLGLSRPDLREGWLTLLIPLLDVVLVTVALLLFQRMRGTARPALVLVAAGFLMYAVSDLTYAARLAQGSFEFGTLVDLGWIAGYVVLSLAAWYPTPDDDNADQGTAGEVLDTVVVFGVLITSAVVQTLLDDPDDGYRGLHLGLLVLLVLAAGLRQTLLVADNAALRRGLEQRVRDQTADLRRLARQTEVLLTSVGDGIYGVDAQGRITFVNPPGATALGYSPEELLGRDAHDTIHAPQPTGTPYPYEGCYVYEAIHHRTVAHAEEDVYQRADGDRVPVEITASPLVDEDVVRGAVVVFRDVTQRQEVDRMKNEFISVVSHELRTPLTSIRGSLGLLASGGLGKLEPRAQSLASIALESSERLTRLINDILDLERIEAGTRPMNLAPADPGDLLEAAVTEMAGQARECDVRLEVGRVEGRVVADRDRIVQTLANLLGNSLKFSDPGSVVSVQAVQQDGEVVFAVRDRGRGIPRESLQAVFERFHQVDSTDARQKGGTGLGLAISRGIVERHGGRIWADSRPGHGTTVSFALPAAPTAGTGPAGAPVVLVCDDDAETVDTVSGMLVRHGFRTIGVSTGQEAIERASADRPAAILLDLRMPGTSGADVVAALKDNARTRRIPVVVVSGLGPEDDPDLAGWAQDWLVKPVNEQRLVDAVGTALAGRLGSGTVLLVEDDADLAELITGRLAAHGMHVVHAATAADAVRRGREVAPQVVVLDLTLPDGHGRQVVAEFRRTEALSGTPLVVYSAADVHQDERARLELGHTVFLTKGRVDPAALEDRVLDLVDALTGRDDEGHQ